MIIPYASRYDTVITMLVVSKYYDASPGKECSISTQLQGRRFAVVEGINLLKYRNIISVYDSGADMDFKIAIEKDEDGWYIVTVPALPGCISQGKTGDEATKNIAEAIELHLSALARDGIPLYHRPGVKETFVAVDI